MDFDFDLERSVDQAVMLTDVIERETFQVGSNSTLDRWVAEGVLMSRKLAPLATAGAIALTLLALSAGQALAGGDPPPIGSRPGNFVGW